jgi:formate-dependent phosphoribosylglycinamide formyltransferase (GAR transformylase)
MSYALCLHRWVGCQALYDRYDLPDGMVMRAICTPESESLASLPSRRLASSSTLASREDAEAAKAEAGRLVKQYGVPVLVVALNEGDLLNAASIRERWAIPGDSVAWTERFRDKLTMLDFAGRQTESVLPAVSADSCEAVERLAASYGYPLVHKPHYGTVSRGVKILRGPGDLNKLQQAIER